MTDRSTTRGGARPGAGRPPKETVAVQFRLDKADADRIATVGRTGESLNATCKRLTRLGGRTVVPPRADLGAARFPAEPPCPVLLRYPAIASTVQDYTLHPVADGRVGVYRDGKLLVVVRPGPWHTIEAFEPAPDLFGAERHATHLVSRHPHIIHALIDVWAAWNQGGESLTKAERTALDCPLDLRVRITPWLGTWTWTVETVRVRYAYREPHDAVDTFGFASSREACLEAIAPIAEGLPPLVHAE